jgi:hypothetical protein
MDLRVDGYISRTFGPAGAEQYITHLLGGFNYQSLQPIVAQQWPGAFLITIPVIQNVLPFTHINGRAAWLLDYQIRSSGTVVPQYIWRPNNPSDARRYTNATYHMPIFFVHSNRVGLGLSLIHAAAGDCRMLLGGLIAAPVGSCSTTYIRIKVGVFPTRTSDNIECINLPCQWPGYDDWYRQIMTRDQTPAHTTISLEKLARRVANAVCLFLDVSLPYPFASHSNVIFNREAGSSTDEWPRPRVEDRRLYRHQEGRGHPDRIGPSLPGKLAAHSPTQ